MPNFAYRGRNSEGQTVSDIIEAHSMDHALDELQRQQILPLHIEPTRKKPRASGESGGLRAFWKRATRPALKNDDLILFCRQMYALTRSGIPLMRAINGLAEATRNERLREVLIDVSRDLTSGNDLATCLARHPKAFNNLFVAMISMGETTGQLDNAFKQLIGHLELEKNTQRQIKQASRYPTFVIIALVAGLAVINYMVIPNFAGVFERMGSELPLMTRILLNSSNFTVAYGPFILGGLIGLYALYRRYIQTQKGRVWRDRLLLRLPLMGSVFERVTMSRFTRPFAMMMDSGVPLLHALTICSRTVGNEYVGQRIRDMHRGIERGDSLTSTARASGMFSPLVLQMIGVGEETGNLSDLLRDVADFYDQEIEYELKTLSSSIEPILIALMGGMVVVLALGVFLPMWEMASSQGGL